MLLLSHTLLSGGTWRWVSVGDLGSIAFARVMLTETKKTNEEEVGSFLLQTSNCPLEPISTELNREQLTEEKRGFQILR